jgi:hypothetical protein
MTYQTTMTDLERLELKQEELIRDYAERAMHPLINSWGEAIQQLVKAELFALRTDVQGKIGDFATHDEVTSVGDKIGGMVSEALLRRVGERFDQESSARIAWQEEIDRKYEARFAALAPLETVERISQTAVLSAAHVTRLEAAHNERLSAVEAAVSELRSTQKDQVKSIGDIRADTDKIAKNAEMMNRTFTESIKREEQRAQDVGRDLNALKDDATQTEKELREMQDDMRKQEIRLIRAESELQPISRVAVAIWKLFTTRRGNMVLAFVLTLFFGMQGLFAFLAYVFIQRIPLPVN